MLRKEGAEALLFAPGDETVFTLNETARLVADSCDGKHSIKVMEAAIVRRFDVTRARAGKDIHRYLAVLRELDLLDD